MSLYPYFGRSPLGWNVASRRMRCMGTMSEAARTALSPRAFFDLHCCYIVLYGAKFFYLAI